MTKTLTEQWKDGRLTDGFYYVSLRDSNDIYIRYLDQTKHSVYFELFKEVLEPVPSYEEYNDLIQQNVNQESAIETYIERIKELEEMFDSAVDALYEYIKMYGIERECSKFLEKYAERVK